MYYAGNEKRDIFMGLVYNLPVIESLITIAHLIDIIGGFNLSATTSKSLYFFRNYVTLNEKIKKSLLQNGEGKKLKVEYSTFVSLLLTSPLTNFNFVSDVLKENSMIFPMSAT